MKKIWHCGAALALAILPATAWAQDGAAFDCAVMALDPAQKALIGNAMLGDNGAKGLDELKHLATVVDGCVETHAIAGEKKADYLEYSIARIAREWLTAEIAAAGLSATIVDRALDFGPTGANPDLSTEMTEDQIMTIVQGFIDSGVEIESVDPAVWERVGGYAASTSIYWSRRARLGL